MMHIAIAFSSSKLMLYMCVQMSSVKVDAAYGACIPVVKVDDIYIACVCVQMSLVKVVPTYRDCFPLASVDAGHVVFR